MWQGWINVLLGVWLIVSPFILGYRDVPAALWNGIIVGVIVAVLSYLQNSQMPANRS
ncbi:MAG: SPW repeat protein [Limnochordaceae bacterium]|nr:SPW repeat protein [Limnochordaceae bacterium]